VAAVVLPKILRSASNRNTASYNSNRGTSNLNLNSNTYNGNVSPGNVNNGNSEVAPPTDEAAVMAALTDLEHQWTVANINADKKKLGEILADDYVGTTADGVSFGKADYIRTIKRDTTTTDWSFEDLKLDLKGNRATLKGTATFKTGEAENRFRFTDKFVWRNGRWQATGSEIEPIKPTSKSEI
jgi:hypothetical protein